MIELLSGKIIRDAARVMDWLESLPADQRLFMTAGTKIQFATEVISIAFLTVRGHAGVTMYYAPRAPLGSPPTLRFYVDAAYEHKCIELTVPKDESRTMAILIAWWIQNTTHFNGEFTKVSDLYGSGIEGVQPSTPGKAVDTRIRSIVQCLSAFILSEKQKETT